MKRKNKRFEPGDRIRIVNYGHLIWYNEGSKGTVWRDMMPDYVGRKATVMSRRKKSYNLNIDGHGSVSWFSEEQMKLLRFETFILRVRQAIGALFRKNNAWKRRILFDLTRK